MFWHFRKSWFTKLTKRLKRYEHKYWTSRTYMPKVYWWDSSFLSKYYMNILELSTMY
jgi:hypothetical protein